jgi:hypothetical protein
MQELFTILSATRTTDVNEVRLTNESELETGIYAANREALFQSVNSDTVMVQVHSSPLLRTYDEDGYSLVCSLQRRIGYRAHRLILEINDTFGVLQVRPDVTVHETSNRATEVRKRDDILSCPCPKRVKAWLSPGQNEFEKSVIGCLLELCQLEASKTRA